MIPVRQLDSLRPVYHMDPWFMCSAIDWKNTCFFFVAVCCTSTAWYIEIWGKVGSAEGSPLSNSCPRNNKAPWHNYKNVCCRFRKIASTWAQHHKRTSNTHTHTHIDMYIYLDVWPGTSTYLLLLGRLINWLLKVLKIENKILRYQNKIPARVRVRGRGGTAHLIRPSRLVRQLGSLRMSGRCAISPAVIRPTDHSCGSVHMCIQQ